MRTIKSLLLLVWLLVASAGGEELSISTSRELDDGDPWPVGTKVYYKFGDDGWYAGEITEFDAGAGYTVTWEDGTKDTYGVDSDEIDEMVDNYEDLYLVGTKVYREFDDGWYKGEITDIDDDRGYTITWEDGTTDVDEYEDDEMDTMVDNYKTQVENGGGDAGNTGENQDPGVDDDPWPIGTKVYYKFEGDGWYTGEITSFSQEEGYTVTWEDDGSTDTYGVDSDEIDEMVDNYGKLLPVGTKVYREFDDGGYKGEITDIDDDGAYTITWEDGSTDYDEYEDDEMDDMVQNYKTQVQNDGGGDAGNTGENQDPSGEVDDPWPVGTKVYYKFNGDGWLGKITSFSQEEGYTVTWEDDGSMNTYGADSDEIDKMVDNYQTMVAGAEVGGTKPGAKFGIVVAAFVGFAVLLCIFYRNCCRKNKAERQLHGMNNSVPDIA